MPKFSLQQRAARAKDRWVHISCEYKKVPMPDGTVVTMLSKGVTFAPGRNKLKRVARTQRDVYKAVGKARREAQRGER